ncbi:MAG: ATP-binding protein, partial [Acidimicrobiales bacterium]
MGYVRWHLEDFLARIEAGQLAHPFRGSVRQRVLALAWHLCKTPRDIKTYLNVAELTQLDAQEMEYIQLLQERLAPRPASVSLPLPPRPARLVGRSSEVSELVQALCAVETGMCAITGMPGVGKSALAYEALHQLASDERQHMRRFPDGIAAFTCVDRKGSSGLVSLLQDVAAAFDPASAKRSASSPSSNHSSAQFDTAAAIDLARMALAGKRVLLLLDELDADFPLRPALAALAGHDENGVTVLTTGRFVPAPALLRSHLHLEPLTPEAALELFTILLGRPLWQGEERQYAEQVCAAVGSLPLALELAAAAVTVGGISLALLAACLAENPLDPLL